MQTFNEAWTDSGPVAQEVFTASFPGFYVIEARSEHAVFIGLTFTNPGLIDINSSGGRRSAVVWLDANDTVYLWSGPGVTHGGYDYTIDVRADRFASDFL